MIDERETAIRDFLLDINCLNDLQKWGNDFNVFEVLKVSRMEIRHSNILAWLLDPNENHMLGDAFVKRLFQSFVKGLSTTSKDAMRLLLIDFYSFSVRREWKNIDILMVSDDEKVIIAFENKIGIREHDNQLERYKDTLNKEYPDYTKLLIYLTPDGDNPSDDAWKKLTYEHILNVLQDICAGNSMPPKIKVVVNDYIDVIRRDVMEDNELVELCNKIYSKHKKALDLIYEYKMDHTEVSDAIKEVLKDFAKAKEIVYENTRGNTYIRFYTSAMTEYLPNLSSRNSSWGNEHSYAYEFRVMNDSYRLACVLAGNNIPDKTADHMKKLLELENENETEINFKWKLLNSKTYDFEEGYLDSPKLKEDIKKAIEYQLNWENEVLSKVAK